MANGVPSGGEAIVHRVRELMDEFGGNNDYVAVSVDAANALNDYSRQQMLNLLVDWVPSLARFINLLYGGEAPYLVFGDQFLRSREGSQKGDPASMLLFCLVIQPMICKITRECDLALNIWFADDGTLVGRPSEVRKALDIIAADGVKVQYSVKAEKSKACWPSMNHLKLRLLTDVYPLALQDDAGGFVLMGALLGSPNFCVKFLDDKLARWLLWRRRWRRRQVSLMAFLPTTFTG